MLFNDVDKKIKLYTSISCQIVVLLTYEPFYQQYVDNYVINFYLKYILVYINMVGR